MVGVGGKSWSVQVCWGGGNCDAGWLRRVIRDWRCGWGGGGAGCWGLGGELGWEDWADGEGSNELR